MDEVTEVEPDYNEGEQIDIVLENDSVNGTYSTQIKGVTDRGFTTEVPEINSLYLPISEGNNLIVKQYEEGATFKSETKVIHRDDSDTPTIMIEIPDVVKRIQRRDFVRVPSDIDTEVIILESGEEENTVSGPLEGKIEDISAGGVQLVLEDYLSLFTKIELIFTLPIVDEELREVFGEIVRVPEDSEPPLRFGVEFTSITENKRNKIIQYVYEMQRKLQD